jgi:hypothetical protein
MYNYKDMLVSGEINKSHLRILKFFQKYQDRKFTAHDVFRIFKKKYPNITINSIAPRISELVDKKYLVYDGYKTYLYESPITGIKTNKKQKYVRIRVRRKY